MFVSLFDRRSQCSEVATDWELMIDKVFPDPAAILHAHPDSLGMERFSGYDDKHGNKPFVRTSRVKPMSGFAAALFSIVVWPRVALFALTAGLAVLVDIVGSVRRIRLHPIILFGPFLC